MAGSLKVTGVAQLTRALQAMAARVEVATPVAVKAAGDLLKSKAQTELSRTSHARGTPTPSVAPQPPAKITGHLHDTWDVLGPTAIGAAIWHEEIGPTAVYARIQELGGQAGRGHATTLPERPYLRPAFEAWIRDPATRETFAKAWARAVRP